MCKCGGIEQGYCQTIGYELVEAEPGPNSTDTNFCLCATIAEEIQCTMCKEKDTIFHYMREEE